MALGQQGFSTQLLGMHAEASTAAAGNYLEAHLSPVQPSTELLDVDIAKRSAQSVLSKNRSTGVGELWGEPPPSAKREYEKRAADATAHQAELAGLQSQMFEKTRMFNAWVPRANSTFLSLGRLEGMQNLMGVTSPQQMVDALVKSLKSAEGIASRANLTGSVDLPKAGEQVTAAGERLTLASQKMHTAWMGYQQTLIKEKQKAIAKLGEKDEAKLKEIRETIATWETIGKTIDLSLTVMGGVGALGEAGSSFSVNQISGQIESVPSDVGAKAKALGKDVAGGVGIPTSAGGLLKGIAGLAYEGEILKIENKLAELNGQIAAHGAVADELGVRQRVRDFQDALAEYKASSKDLHRRILDRQMAYLKVGQQLDAAARRDAIAKREGHAPGTGKEGFATVMLLTAQVREVLAVASGATSGAFMQPKDLEIWIGSYNETRCRPVYGHGSVRYQTPPAELLPLGQMLVQTRQFFANVAELVKVLGSVDKQAGSVMLELGGRQAEYAAY